MSATQQPSARPEEEDDALADGQVRPIPDEDGPHDVPDDMVIEKTLPTTPLPDPGR